MIVRPGTCGWLAALTLGAWLTPDHACAQSVRDGRVEVDGGLLWAGKSRVATESANEVSFGGQSRAVFESRTELESSPGLATRVGVRLTAALQVEGAVAFNSTRLTTRVTDDTEASGGRTTTATASESVKQYLFEGGLVLRPTLLRRGRVTPFVTAGAGHLRHLHEGQTLVETGRSYYVGVGASITYAGGAGGRRRAAGLRLDARAMMLQDGVSADHALHAAPAVGASLFVRF